jgi:MFS family permease
VGDRRGSSFLDPIEQPAIWKPRPPGSPRRGFLVGTMTLAQPATAAPSTSVVAAICAAEILGLAGFSIVPALLPQFIEAWSLTNTQAGWLAGIPSAGYMLAVIPLVSLTDRRLARQLYLASSALSALSCFGMALSDSLLPALGFRALAGIAMAGMYMPGLRAPRMVWKGQPARASRPGTPAPSPSVRRCRSCSAGSERCWAGAALLLSPAFSAPPAS